jgi:hypothetical protein
VYPAFTSVGRFRCIWRFSQDTEQIDNAEKGGEDAGIPIGEERDSGYNEERTDKISADGAAGCPGRDGREPTSIMALKKILNTEGRERDGKKEAAELPEAVHSGLALPLRTAI